MHYIVFDNPKVIFGWTQKCGCSHIKNIAYFLKTDKILNEHRILHESFTVDAALPAHLDAYKIFLIIRNPYKRCVSGFIEKICARQYAEKDEIWPRNSKLPLTFYNFIYAMVNKTVINFNRFFTSHFNPQSKNTAVLENHKNTTVYDLEHIDYQHIGSFFNKNIPPAVINYRGGHEDKNTVVVDKYVGNLLYSEYATVKPLTRNFFCPKTKKLFDNYYKADFHFLRARGFNYELDLSDNVGVVAEMCARTGCTYAIHSNPLNNNGKYCCFACMSGKDHGPLCELTNIKM